MASLRQPSFSAGSESSFGGSSLASSKLSALTGIGGNDGAGAGSDLADQGQSFMSAVFGVLFTLSKEKVDSSRKFAAAKIALEFIQLFMLLINKSFHWDMNEDLWIWKILKLFHFKNPIVSMGYKFYVGVLYTTVVILALSLLLCFWVAWCFKVQRFPYVWPIKVLRLFVSVFFQVFFVASLSVFLVACDCHFLASEDSEFKKGYLEEWPDTRCLSTPHVIHFMLSIVMCILFILTTLAVTAADFELDPLSKRWLAAATSDFEVYGIFAKAIATASFSFIGDVPKVQTVVIAVCICSITYFLVKKVPHMYPWTNHVRIGLYGALSWISCMLLLLWFPIDRDNPDQVQRVTVFMLYGIIPFFFIFMAISWFRLRWTTKRVQNAFRYIDAEQMVNLRPVYRFKNVRQVEIGARICRTWDKEDDEKLDEESVKLAELIMKGGMSHFSSNPDMLILMSNFTIEVLRKEQAGHSQLIAAKKLNPHLGQKFVIFVREQLHTQRAQSQANGEDTSDLVSYVEFQRNYQLLLKNHKSALQSTRNFWKLLMHSEISFKALSKAFARIDASHGRAEKLYRVVLERYPTSAKILKCYARFLEDVKNDPGGAARYYVEAEKAEEARQANESNALLAQGADGEEGGNLLANVNDSSSPMIMINASGSIQMINKVALALLGYKKGELDGKNINMLMPNPFSAKHNSYLNSYIKTGKSRVLNTTREVVALHKMRYVFPTRLAVTKVSGEGTDAMFMGVLQPVPDDPNSVRAYLSTTGQVLCVDQRFVDWFGRMPAECVGRMFNTLVVEQDRLQRLVTLASMSSEADMGSGKVSDRDISILHKYMDPVHCDVSVQLGGTEANRLLILVISRLQPADNMMVTDKHGRVTYVTTSLASMLLYTPSQLVGDTLNKLLPPPFDVMHSSVLKETLPSKIPMGSCRSDTTVIIRTAKMTGMPVRVHISTRDDGDQTMHVASITPSSFEAGMDERRMVLKIEASGEHMGVVTELVGNHRKMFSYKPADVVGHHLADFVDVFRLMWDGKAQGAKACREVLELLIHRARDPDVLLPSFRVGTHPPGMRYRGQTQDKKTHETDSAVQLRDRQTKPAIMTVKVIVDPDTGVEDVRVELFHADFALGVVEIDQNGTIMKSGCCVLHDPGVLFGIQRDKLLHQNIRGILGLPKGANLIQELMRADAAKGKRGALKNSQTVRKYGPPRMYHAAHLDCEPNEVDVQCFVRQGINNRWLLRCRYSKRSLGKPNFLQQVKKALEHANHVGDGELDLNGLHKGESGLAGLDGDWLGQDKDAPSRQGNKDVAGRRKVRSGAGVGVGLSFRPGREEEEPGQQSSLQRRSVRMSSSIRFQAGDQDAAAEAPVALTAEVKLGKVSDKSAGIDDAVERQDSWGDAKQDILQGVEDLPALKLPGPVDEDPGESASHASSDEMKNQQGAALQSDPRRGKRCKRLIKMLGNKKALAVVNRFRLHSTLVTLLLVAAHIACFAVVTIFLDEQLKGIQELNQCGRAQVYMHHVALYNRIMDTLTQNKSGPIVNGIPSYLASEVDKYAGLLMDAASSLATVHQGAYLGFSKLRHLEDTSDYQLSTVWETRNISAQMYYDTSVPYVGSENATLWELGNDVVAAAREVATNFRIMTANNTKRITKNRHWYFVNSNAPGALYDGYKHVMVGMLERAKINVDNVHNMMLILLAVEACCLATLALLYTLHLIKSVGQFRYTVYSVFLIIPTACLRALASKKAVIDDDDDGDDSDEDEGGNNNNNAQESAKNVAASMGTGQGAVLKLATRPPNKQLRPQGTSESDLGMDAKHSTGNENRSWWSVVTFNAFSSVPKRSLPTKKKLVVHPMYSLHMLIPYTLWAVVVVTIYAVSFASLASILGPLHTLNVANMVHARVARTIYFINELPSESTDAEIKKVQASLNQRITDLSNDWKALQLGYQEGMDASYQGVESTIFLGEEHAFLFFRDKECLDEDQNTCLEEETGVYYQVTHHATNPMLRRLLDEAKTLMYASTQEISFNSSRIHYAYRVGMFGLRGGLERELALYNTFLESLIKSVQLEQVILLVVSLGIAISYYFFMIRPFMSATTKESKRVAELLSQLPPDLDVEGLLADVLGVKYGGIEPTENGNGRKGRRASMEMVQAYGKGGAPNGQQHDDSASSTGSG